MKEGGSLDVESSIYKAELDFDTSKPFSSCREFFESLSNATLAIEFQEDVITHENPIMITKIWLQEGRGREYCLYSRTCTLRVFRESIEHRPGERVVVSLKGCQPYFHR